MSPARIRARINIEMMRKLVKKLKMIIQKAYIKQDQNIMTPDRYIQSIKSPESTTSAIADEMTILNILS
jgi:hypothetical protein